MVDPHCQGLFGFFPKVLVWGDQGSLVLIIRARNHLSLKINSVFYDWLRHVRIYEIGFVEYT